MAKTCQKCKYFLPYTSLTLSSKTQYYIENKYNQCIKFHYYFPSSNQESNLKTKCLAFVHKNNKKSTCRKCHSTNYKWLYNKDNKQLTFNCFNCGYTFIYNTLTHLVEPLIRGEKSVCQIYTDGGFDWISNLNKNPKLGVIAYKINNERVKQITISIKEIKGLKQYSNLMEFIASIEALEQAVKQFDRIILYTDSKVNKSWLLNNKKHLKSLSTKHAELKKRALRVISQLKSFTVIQIPREKNKAGKVLEKKYNL